MALTIRSANGILLSVVAVAALALIARAVLDAPQPVIERVFRAPAPSAGTGASASAVARSSRAPAAALPASASSAPASVASSAAPAAQVPGSVLIEVPFASQAPHGNWDPPYDEACEEASLILAAAYRQGHASVSPDEMDRQIKDLVAWEAANAMPIDITIAQLQEVARAKYGLDTEIVDDPTVDDIKEALAAGNPVIVPLAGRQLGNPYYSGEGPWYHVLVIVGYDATHFITNDVGTKRGAQYRYSYDVLHDAIHDWTGVKEEITQGKKTMLVVK